MYKPRDCFHNECGNNRWAFPGQLFIISTSRRVKLEAGDDCKVDVALATIRNGEKNIFKYGGNEEGVE